MNAKQAKRARKVVDKENPFVLLKLIEEYGSATKQMTKAQVYKNVKRLVRDKKIDLKEMIQQAERGKIDANSKS
jgi:hypothetical protein